MVIVVASGSRTGPKTLSRVASVNEEEEETPETEEETGEEP